MASYGYTFQNGDVVTPAKLNDARTISNIQTADIADSQITTAKIADANITTAKIVDGNITTNKLASGSVTADKIASGAIPAAIPAGAIMPFAMNSAPTGWLAADGAEYSKTGIYAALFAAIGTAHGETNGSGGAGTSHFRVPDLRGIFVRGSGSQTISGITYSGALGTKQADEFKSHTHNVAVRSFNTGGLDSVAGSTTATNGTISNAALATGGTETRPANIALLYCIKF